MRPSRSELCLLALAFVLGSAGCDDQAGLEVVGPEIRVEPRALDFGEVPFGSARRLPVEVQNVGRAPLRVTEFDIEPPFFLEPDPALEQPLPPGSRLVLTIGFRPDGEEASARLGLGSDDPSQPRVEVSLAGRGTAGWLSFDPGRIDFGPVAVGTERKAELRVIHIGLEPEAGPLFVDAARPGAFSMLGAPVDRELVVGAREEVVLELVYRPFEPGLDSGWLRFETCGPGCGIEVEIVAEAVAPLVRLEPPVIDFGEVALGSEGVAQVVGTHLGTAPLTVEAMAVRGSPNVTLSVDRAIPGPLLPGESFSVILTWRPAGAAPLDARLQVGFDDPSFPAGLVGLGGQGVGPLFLAQPERLSFGVVGQTAPSGRSLIALNAGSAPVDLEAVEIEGADELELGTLPPLPVRLQAGETAALRVVFSPSGPGVRTATVSLKTSDPLRTEVRVPVVAAYSERACRLDLAPVVAFGALVPGFSRERELRVENQGSGPCALVSGRFRPPEDPSFEWLGPNPLPASLASGERVVLTFRFSPTEERDAKAVFELRTDEILSPVRTVGLFGAGAGSLDVVARPRVLDFGGRVLGCGPAARSIMLVNNGTIPAELLSISLTSSASAFSLAAPPLPVQLSPRGSARAEVAFTPSSAGAAQGELEVEVRDLPHRIVVPLLGRGNEGTTERERFEVPREARVDVLMVIDDSCSMSDKQGELAANLDRFLAEASASGSDFQIGVTTTTVQGRNGALVGPVLSARQSGLESAFRQQVMVGTSGSPFEMGLEAALAAVRRADRGFAPNSGLFRPGARAALIVISDEDDQSPQPVDFYAGELTARLPTLSAAAVTGQSAGCSFGSRLGALPSPRYETFLQAVGGLSASICADWGSTLAALGQSAFGVGRRFSLSSPIRAGTAPTVEVDGRPLNPSEYVVDRAGNAVVLQQTPRRGAVVIVEYEPQC